jgi:hypothetical protein
MTGLIEMMSYTHARGTGRDTAGKQPAAVDGHSAETLSGVQSTALSSARLLFPPALLARPSCAQPHPPDPDHTIVLGVAEFPESLIIPLYSHQLNNLVWGFGGGISQETPAANGLDNADPPHMPIMLVHTRLLPRSHDHKVTKARE